MGLSNAAAQAHIDRWTQELAHSYRTKWPSRLFHHAPLENAVEILKSGCLQSRSATTGNRPKDVAALGVIDTTNAAHASVRCYFRPRTPTQFHIEGIRKDSDCQLGVNAHAPVLIMFVLNASQVLTKDGTRFSDRNMQKQGAQVGTDDAFFASIPFDMVYHEGSYPAERAMIKDHRAAEVLPTSPLDLDEVLQWALCRSEPERETLLHHLGEHADRWRARILVSDDLKVFEKRFPFVQEARLTREGLTFRINPRPDRAAVSIDLTIWDTQGAIVAQYSSTTLALPPPNAQSWIHRTTLNDGVYRIKMTLEGHLAYEGYQAVGSQLF